MLPSLVGTLRPFTGCREDSFSEFMRLALYEHGNSAQHSKVDRELVRSLLCTCQALRLLVLSGNGPIKRNKLADADQLSKLEMRHDIIESFTVHALSGHESHVCLQRLIHYLRYSNGADLSLYAFLIPVVRLAADDLSLGIDEDAKFVLRKLEVGA